MGKRAVVVLLAGILILIGAGEAYGFSAYDFGIRSVERMPSVDGCRDSFDEELYYAGMAAGVDPAFLKVIMKKESGGNPNVADNINRGASGVTKDIGIMQINTTSADALGIKDYNELRSNHWMNIWASTEVIKWKYNLVKRNKGVDISGVSVRGDSFSIFWGYNGLSSAGLNYAKEASELYERATKLNKVRRGGVAFYRGIMREAMAKNADDFMVVLADDVVREGTMTYDEFVERVEDLSDGRVVPEKANIDNSERKSLEEILRDETKALGVVNENTPEDVLLNYNIYKFVKFAVKYIYLGIVFMTYIVVVLLGFVWVGYILNSAGVGAVSGILMRVSGQRMDLNSDGVFSQLVGITAVVLVLIAASLTGVVPVIIEQVIVRIVMLFS